jgi:mono/diheme cytochrome c family protein
MSGCRALWAGVVFFCAWASVAADGPSAGKRKVDFERDVKPFFAKYCYDCHGPRQQLSGLRLDRKDAVLKHGGYSGQVIIPGDAEGSRMVRMLSGNDGMPMPIGEPKPTRAEIDLLRAWIDQGAVWPDEPAPPAANSRSASSPGGRSR